MNRSPRLHLERLEDRITPDATMTMTMTMTMTPPTTTPPDQVVITPVPPAPTYYNVPTPAQMIAMMNAYLATLPPSGGGDTGLGTGLGGGSSGN
jgi:hypothetical protein